MIQQYILGVNESGGTKEIDQISVTAPPNFLSTLTFNHLTMSIKSLSKEFVHGAKYYYNSKIEKNKQKIKALVTPEEFEKINHFDTIMITEALSDSRRSKSMGEMLRLTRLLDGKNWLTLTRFEVNTLIAKLMQTYSDDGKETNTTYDTKVHLKIFMRWLKFGNRSYKEVGDVPEVADIKCRTVADKLVRENMLDDKDKANLINASETIQDKAAWALDYEAGLRPGELLNLQIKHIQPINFGKTKGIKIAVDGKTGARPVILIDSESRISAWIASHPFNDDPNAPLWLQNGKQMTYEGMNDRLKKACKIAKIKKNVNLKLFRHSAATNLAVSLTETLMRKRFGWSATSKMPSKYAHIVQSDVEERYLEICGIEKQSSIKRTPKSCPRCDHSISIDDEMCDKCMMPLSIQKAEEMAQIERDAETKRLTEIALNVVKLQKELTKQEYDNV